jgi:hypothetical protein
MHGMKFGRNGANDVGGVCGTNDAAVIDGDFAMTVTEVSRCSGAAGSGLTLLRRTTT